MKVDFEKIVPEGKALGYCDGRACFVVGPLPGEQAEVVLTKQKARYCEAQLVQITRASPHRQPAAENHFLACSPWQGVDYPYQLELKRHMLDEVFQRPGLDLPVSKIVPANQLTGYRNKLEFALVPDANGLLELAFHERRQFDRFAQASLGCQLGTPAMNEAAIALVKQLNQHPGRQQPQSLMVRQSRETGEAAAVAWWLNPKTGSNKVIAQLGPDSLSETIGGQIISYPQFSFFQTNVEMFEQALADILQSVPAGCQLVDVFGGVGAIGIPAAARAQTVIGVEIDEAAARQATDNAATAKASNYESQAVSAESLDAGVLRKADCVTVDPPRAGLSRQVVDALLQARPARIIYLSCNPVTQARDIIALAGAYQPGPVTGYDFYPGTLHLESLVVLNLMA